MNTDIVRGKTLNGQHILLVHPCITGGWRHPNWSVGSTHLVDR